MKPVPKPMDNKELTDESTIVYALRNLYADNFAVYYKSHTYHFNVEGPTFLQDHMLLEEIYTFLQESHDTLGELIRQMHKEAPPSLKVILDLTNITEAKTAKVPSKAMFNDLNNDFTAVHESGQWLFHAFDEAGYGGLNTAIGDYLKELSKLHWKIQATLGVSFK